MKKNVLKIIKFFVGWPLSALALIFLWHIFTPQLPQIMSKLSHVDIWVLFFSLVSFEMYFLFRVVLWQHILAKKGHHVAFTTTASYWSIAEINRYIPGNIWSIIGRGNTFGKLGIPQSTLLFAWAQESFLVLLGSLLVSLLGVGIIFSHIIPTFVYKSLVLYGVIGISLISTLLWVFQKYVATFFPLFQKYTKVLPNSSTAFIQLVFTWVSFFFFGLGTYLGIYAVVPLSIPDAIALVGVCSASFFAGYASLIAPMGLGIREFVMSEGLLPFVAYALVGFLSLFARFLLIVAEVLFLITAYLLHRIKFTIPTLLRENTRKYGYYWALAGSMVAYISYFITASVLRYTNFFTGRFDLGNMDQTVWNTLHGKIFQLTDPNGTNIMSRLGTHADFLLILIAPFYLLWQDPRTLLIIQTVIIAGGALFVFLIAKDVIKKNSFAFILALSYLLNPSIQNANLYDFHAVTLATTFFLAAWYFLKKRKYWWSVLFLFLAGITKEEAWLVVGLFGIYMALWEKKKIVGSIVAALSFISFYLLIWKFIPLARGGQHFALSYYADFGNTPTSIIKNIILSPSKIFSLLFAHTRILYVYELLLPVGFVALLAPQYLLFSLSELGINLLSTNAQMQQIFYQYTAVITPFVFIATIYGAKNILAKYKKLPLAILSGSILACALASAYWYGPLPGAIHPNIDMLIKQETDRGIIEGFLQDIPASFSVAATNNIGSHLSHRQKIFTIPVGIDQADIVVFLLNDAFAQPSLSAQKQMAENMKHDKNYIEVFKENDFIVFEKRNLYTRQEPTIEKGKLYPAAIEALQHRDFEGGKITIQKIVQKTDTFTAVLFSYPSDGLTLYGKADIPNATNLQTAFPVVIINRGYIQPSVFQEETSYQNISEAFVQNGFIAITPNYRNNGESDKDRSIASILGYPIDVLNLINSLPNFPQANTKHVFLWGFSIGGQVTLSTVASYDQNNNITPTIKAASVWNTVVDPYTAYIQFHTLFPNSSAVPYGGVARAFGSFAKTPIPWESISPLYYLQDITTPVRIVDAYQDPITPSQWSIALYDDLKYYHNNAELQLYNTDHNFTNTWKEAVAGDIVFFQSFLK